MTAARPAALPVRGIALGLYPGAFGGPGAAWHAGYQTMIDEIARTGATHVALTVSWVQQDVGASRIAPAGDITARDDDVRALAAHARARGLRVMMFPILILRETGPGKWRGTLRPDDVGAWWLAYERFVLHYASLADAIGAEVFSVGSELGSTETWRGRWYHLISRVENRFAGKLVYSANWDHYTYVSFWRRLDAIGVTGYFELTGDADASEATLTRAWRPVRAALERFAREAGKPLWITEIGYPSRDGGAVWPWNYTRSAPVDVEEQRRAYAAFIRAWRGSTVLEGVFIWNWFGKGGPTDDGYTPKGKPAGKLLERWYRAP